jgi:hypothetical protein
MNGVTSQNIEYAGYVEVTRLSSIDSLKIADNSNTLSRKLLNITSSPSKSPSLRPTSYNSHQPSFPPSFQPSAKPTLSPRSISPTIQSTKFSNTTILLWAITIALENLGYNSTTSAYNSLTNQISLATISGAFSSSLSKGDPIFSSVSISNKYYNLLAPTISPTASPTGTPTSISGSTSSSSSSLTTDSILLIAILVPIGVITILIGAFYIYRSKNTSIKEDNKNKNEKNIEDDNKISERDKSDPIVVTTTSFEDNDIEQPRSKNKRNDRSAEAKGDGENIKSTKDSTKRTISGFSDKMAETLLNSKLSTRKNSRTPFKSQSSFKDEENQLVPVSTDEPFLVTRKSSKTIISDRKQPDKEQDLSFDDIYSSSYDKSISKAKNLYYMNAQLRKQLNLSSRSVNDPINETLRNLEERQLSNREVARLEKYSSVLEKENMQLQARQVTSSKITNRLNEIEKLLRKNDL